MGDHSKIEWTDATWNPVVGCSVVSPGCTNCYAMRFAGRRLKHTGKYRGLTRARKAGPVWTGETRLWERALTEPLRWRKPRKIFVNSEGDLFHESIPDEWIDRVFAVMALAPQHTFQVLTKRSKRAREYLTAPLQGSLAGRIIRVWDDGVARPETAAPWRIGHALTDMLPTAGADALNRAVAFMDKRDGGEGDGFFRMWPLPNVWFGVSCEDQPRADERIPHLLETPAAVKFVSCEPLLGPIDLRKIDGGALDSDAAGICLDSLTGGCKSATPWHLNWVIVGGESGRDARPMHPDWARALRDDCADAGVAFFFKQWGEWLGGGPERFSASGCTNLHQWGDGVFSARVGRVAAGRLLDGREHNAFPGANQ